MQISKLYKYYPISWFNFAVHQLFYSFVLLIIFYFMCHQFNFGIQLSQPSSRNVNYTLVFLHENQYFSIKQKINYTSQLRLRVPNICKNGLEVKILFHIRLAVVVFTIDGGFFQNIYIINRHTLMFICTILVFNVFSEPMYGFCCIPCHLLQIYILT